MSRPSQPPRLRRKPSILIPDLFKHRHGCELCGRRESKPVQLVERSVHLPLLRLPERIRIAGYQLCGTEPSSYSKLHVRGVYRHRRELGLRQYCAYILLQPGRTIPDAALQRPERLGRRSLSNGEHQHIPLCCMPYQRERSEESISRSEPVLDYERHQRLPATPQRPRRRKRVYWQHVRRYGRRRQRYQ